MIKTDYDTKPYIQEMTDTQNDNAKFMMACGVGGQYKYRKFEPGSQYYKNEEAIY